MWICSRLGFYSIACARNPDGSLDSDTVMVRARRKAHLQNLQARFPAIVNLEIFTTPKNDYRYRLILAKSKWVTLLTELVMEQQWSNFKNEAARNQSLTGADYVDALHEIWTLMHQLQTADIKP
jgi:hypothetical protein